MKCVKNLESGKIERIRDDEAHVRVKSNKWAYVPKNVWKESKK